MKSPAPVTPFLLRQWFVLRAKDSHKGDCGHVLAAAGSRGMTGAARLCASAALRSGAGLVTLAVPQSEYAVVAASAPWEVLTLPLPDTPAGAFHQKGAGEALDFIKARRVTALALGPGLSADPSAARFVKDILSAASAPVVLDADGLNAVAREGWPDRLRAPVAATPHPGEMARLLKISAADVQANRLQSALRLARERGVICVLKGRQTLITDGERAFINPTGNPGMATGGTGDVLTGLIAGLVAQAQGADAAEQTLRAAVAAVYLHGLAGDLAALQKTRLGLVAGDLLDFLPMAYRKVFGNKI